MELDYNAIGKRIKIERIKANVTQEQLAETLEVSPPYVSRLEKGSKKVNLTRLMQIADALSLDSLDPLLFDSIAAHKQLFDSEASELLDDCDHFERRQLIEQMRDNKSRMRAIKDYYQK